MPNLTKRQCDKLQTFGNHCVAPHLYLSIRPQGSRCWLFRYRRGDKTTWLGLGATNLISLDAAKGEALALRLALRAGRDPLADKRAGIAARQGAATFATVAASYIDDHKPEWKSPKSLAAWNMTVATYANPIIGRLAVADITASHVAAILRPMRRIPETAKRLRGRIARIIDYATAKGLRPAGENPAAWRILRHLLPATTRKPVAHHNALPWQDVPQLCGELQANGSTSARALLFTILTTSRTGETIGAVWDEIDMQAATWTIPAGRMKSGREHRVPLSPAALALIGELRANLARSYIFPGGKLGKPLSNMAMLELLRGVRGMGATVHGLRSSFRDWCADTNAAPHGVCEAALAHAVKDKTEGAYLRTDYLDARRPLMTVWANFCMGTVEPKFIRHTLLERRLRRSSYLQ